eukprot:3745184-Rhodomonas_salina.1
METGQRRDKARAPVQGKWKGWSESHARVRRVILSKCQCTVKNGMSRRQEAARGGKARGSQEIEERRHSVH